MQAIISGRNSKLLAVPEPEKRSCNCRKNAICPLDGKCFMGNIVYSAKVTQNDQTTNSYVGLSAPPFKSRLGTHKTSFKNDQVNQTSLSTFIWGLKEKNISYDVSWKYVDQAKPFSPVTGTCGLCIREKFHIMFSPALADLNKKSEIYSNCRHKHSALLIKRIRKKKVRTPG